VDLAFRGAEPSITALCSKSPTNREQFCLLRRAVMLRGATDRVPYLNVLARLASSTWLTPATLQLKIQGVKQ
jgi:hypothetical protein